MLAPVSRSTSTAAHNSEAEQLYTHLAGLASLVAFPAATLPRDIATVAAAARVAHERIGELLPRYCGFGLGEVVGMAGKPAGTGAARVKSLFINETGSPSILLRAVGADGIELDHHLQLPLFYARSAMVPSDLALPGPDVVPSAPAP